MALTQRVVAILPSRNRKNGKRFTPLAIADLVAWFDFTDPAYIWQESTRTTPVSALANPIGFVAPKGGSAMADIANLGFSQAVGGSRPLWQGTFAAMTAALELTGPASALIAISGNPWTLAGVARYNELPGVNDPLVQMAAGVELRGNTSGADFTIGGGTAATVGTASSAPISLGRWFSFILTYGVRSTITPANVKGGLVVNGAFYSGGNGFEFTTNEAASSRKPTLSASTKSRDWRDLVLIGRDLTDSRDRSLLQTYLNKRTALI